MTKTADTNKTMQVSIQKGGLCEVTVGGVKIAAISSNGNVTTFTNKALVTKTASRTAKKVKGIEIGQAFNAVAVYGTKVKIAKDGVLTVHTKGIVTAKMALDTMPGDAMADGTVYVGVSPETGNPLFATPADAPATMSLEAAEEYAKSLEIGGKKDFRLPSKAELELVFKVRNSGVLAETFNTRGNSFAGNYWLKPASTYGVCGLRFSDGATYAGSQDVVSALRCVR